MHTAFPAGNVGPSEVPKQAWNTLKQSSNKSMADLLKLIYIEPLVEDGIKIANCPDEEIVRNT